MIAEPVAVRTEYVFGYRKHDGSPIRHFSPSSAKAYATCGECFRLDKYDHAPVPTRVYLPQGSAVHKAFEYARKTWRAVDRYAVAPKEFADQPAPFTMAKALETTARGFAKNLLPKLADDAPVQDAIAAVHQAIEEGDINLDLAGRYPTMQEAIADSQRWVEAALPPVIAWERSIGYQAIEAAIFGYDAVLPFAFGSEEDNRPVALDVMLADQRIVDVKTSKDRSLPDWQTTWQLQMYALPWWAAGEPFKLGVVQIVKHPKQPFPLIHDLPVSDAQMKHGLDQLLLAAEDIQRGSFPCRPSWRCKYPHDLPVYISLPLEMAA